MLELSTEQIGAWVGSFLLPLFRIASLLMVMPIIGTKLVPTRVRLYLSLAICLVLVPVLPPILPFDPLSLQAVMLIAQEILIGIMLGFTLQLFFHLFSVAGQIIAVQTGLGFASMIDPGNGVSVPVLGQLLLILVTLLFLAMNAHLVVFEILAESFITLPIGSGLSTNHYWVLAGQLGWVLGAGLLLVLPAITALLVVNLAFGIMTRAAPQLNIISIGFPMTLVIGLVIFWLGLADFLAHYQLLASEGLQLLRELAQER
ncbi:MAG: flagellar biosynthetic protein FliR [Pseudomonas sp.]|jgi:flagellar biosynthetic protein FliR